MCYDSDLAGFITAYQTMSRYEPACRCWALWTAGRRRRLRTQALIHERRQSAAVRLSETHTHTHTHVVVIAVIGLLLPTPAGKC